MTTIHARGIKQEALSDNAVADYLPNLSGLLRAQLATADQAAAAAVCATARRR